jgi:hypothetical protein
MKGVGGAEQAMEREGLRPCVDRCGHKLRGYFACSDANRQVRHLLDGGCNTGGGVVTTTVARRVTVPLGSEDLRGNFLVPRAAIEPARLAAGDFETGSLL